MSAALDGFLQYLRVERNASSHTVEAYRSDILEFLRRVMEADESFNAWSQVERNQARRFVSSLFEAGDSKRASTRSTF